MIRKCEWDFSNPAYPEIKDLGKVDFLYMIHMVDSNYHELWNKGIKLPYISSYIYECKEGAIRWAHHCLKDFKDSIKEKVVYGDEKQFLVEYIYTLDGEDYVIARATTTGLILENCSNEDW